MMGLDHQVNETLESGLVNKSHLHFLFKKRKKLYSL